MVSAAMPASTPLCNGRQVFHFATGVDSYIDLKQKAPEKRIFCITGSLFYPDDRIFKSEPILQPNYTLL